MISCPSTLTISQCQFLHSTRPQQVDSRRQSHKGLHSSIAAGPAGTHEQYLFLAQRIWIHWDCTGLPQQELLGT